MGQAAGLRAAILSKKYLRARGAVAFAGESGITYEMKGRVYLAITPYLRQRPAACIFVECEYVKEF